MASEEFAHYVRSGQTMLRRGYTTGTCAALAAAGAVRLLLTGRAPEAVSLTTPKGIEVSVSLAEAELPEAGRTARCAVRKNAGDDYDVTDGMLVWAAVRKSAAPGVRIDGGEGVGRVTRPGLDQPVGAAAINRVPRRMIAEQVEAVCRDMPSVAVAGTGEYLISSATFPDYFLKDRTRAGAVWADLDIAVFCRLARTLGVTRRFVGSEPFCPVTAAYNRAMAAALPEQGVELVELDRLERGGQAVSATAVRGLVRAGRWRETEPLVPAETFAWLAREENRRLLLERAGEA